jgi:putative inorganic carbon (hco3(-)) transporter
MKGLLFTYLMTYGGASLSLLNPFYGLLVYICFAIVRPEFMWYWSVPEGNYSRIVAVGLIIGWLFHGTGNWNFGRARAIVYSLIAFLGWTTVVSLMAENREIAMFYTEMLAKVVLPFVIGATLIDSTTKLLQLAWTIALSEAYVGLEMNLAYLAGWNRAYEGFGSLDNNGLAVTMVCGAAFALFLGMETRSWIAKGVAFLGAICMLHVVLFSFSRGGMLGLVITAFAGFWIIPKRPQHVLAFFVAVGLGVMLAGKEVRDRFTSSFAEGEERDKSAQSRIDLWKDCLAVMADHPWGIGPGQFEAIEARKHWGREKAAHTTWLQIGAEQGVPGFVAILMFYLFCLFRLRPLAKERTPDNALLCSLARVVIATIPGFMVAAQFVSLATVEVPYYAVLVGVGVLRLSSAEYSVEEFEDMPLAHAWEHDELLDEDLLPVG